MLSDKIKELYPAHATPEFLEFLKEQIGVEMLRVLNEKIQYSIKMFGHYDNILSNEELVNLIMKEI